jgi:hypothetical protein
MRFHVEDEGPRHRALQRIRSPLRQRGEKLRDKGVSGASVAARRRAGSVHPYHLGQLEAWITVALGDMARAPRVVAFCRWVLAVKLGRLGAVLTSPHRHTAILLDASTRTAGDVVREAVRLGLVVQYHHQRRVYLDGKSVLRDEEASYSPSALLLALVQCSKRGHRSSRASGLLGSWSETDRPVGLAKLADRRRKTVPDSRRRCGPVGRSVSDQEPRSPEAREERARAKLRQLAQTLGVERGHLPASETRPSGSPRSATPSGAAQPAPQPAPPQRILRDDSLAAFLARLPNVTARLEAERVNR